MIGSMVEYEYVCMIFKGGTRYLYVPDNPGIEGGGTLGPKVSRRQVVAGFCTLLGTYDLWFMIYLLFLISYFLFPIYHHILTPHGVH